MRVTLGKTMNGNNEFVAIGDKIFVADAFELHDERVNPVLVAKKRGRPRKNEKHASGNSSSAPQAQAQNA